MWELPEASALPPGLPSYPQPASSSLPSGNRTLGARGDLGPRAELSALIAGPVGRVGSKPPCQCVPSADPPLTQAGTSLPRGRRSPTSSKLFWDSQAAHHPMSMLFQNLGQDPARMAALPCPGCVMLGSCPNHSEPQISSWSKGGRASAHLRESIHVKPWAWPARRAG